MAFIRLIQRKIRLPPRFDTITYDEMLAQGLEVMDASAVALMQEMRIFR